MKKRSLVLCSFIFLMLLFSMQSLYAQDFYWENPEKISSSDSYFPSSAYNTDAQGNKTSVIIWQEVVNKKQIYLSAKICRENSEKSEWYKNERFAGPFPFAGEVPNMSSVAVNRNGKIAVAVLSSDKSITVFTSEDYGKTFIENPIKSANETIIAPRIYATSKGGFMVFASHALTKADISSFTLLYAKSSTGASWSSFSTFSLNEKIMNPFVPFLYDQGEKDILVFQASNVTIDPNNVSKSKRTYQLYSTYTKDNGNSWSEPIMITDSSLRLMNQNSEMIMENYHNQRPFVFKFEGKNYIAWERTFYTSESSQIYAAEFSDDGRIINPITLISSGNGNASTPVLFEFAGKLSIIWTDSRSGSNRIYFSQKNGILWNERALSDSKKESTFGSPLVTNSGKDFNLFWQQLSDQKKAKPQIIQLSPDRSVAMPKIKALSYTTKKKYTAEKVSSRVILPADSTGIEGFAWIWTQDENEHVPETFMNLPNQTSMINYASQDGTWYLKVKALDYAGNWSDEAVIQYTRDTTPPLAPIIVENEKDQDGFEKSNTLTLKWKKADESDDDVAGYTYNIEYIANEKADLEELKSKGIKVAPPSSRLMTENNSRSYRNLDNGIYAFSVSAIDSCGNISKSTTSYIKLNKYIPYTTITSAKYSVDEYGSLDLSIYGKGFTSEGKITKVYIDADGKAPYDKVFDLNSNEFRLFSDRRIGGIQLEDMDEGYYKIGLYHTGRGLYMSSSILHITESGTVKTGDYSYIYEPSWKVAEHKKYKIDISTVILLLIFLLCMLGLTASIYGLVKISKDSILLKQEIKALMTGDNMPLKKKEKAQDLQKIGFSLKYKLITVTATLIVMIIFLVSIPLSYIMIKDQEETLAESLENQANVLMNSLSTGVRTYLPAQNILELSFLPDQATALSQANYVTIVGIPESGRNTNIDYLWASNDSQVNSKIDTKERTYGRSRLVIPQMEEITKNCKELNEIAIDKVSSIAQEVSELTREGISLALRTDRKSVARREEIGQVTTALNAKLNETLSEISNQGTSSIPAFDNKKLDRKNTTYLFYKPVLYRQGSEENFVRAVVILEISTDDLIEDVDKARNRIFYITGGIAFIGIVIGIIVSLIFANVIVLPLRKLTKHVKMIRDTGNKAELEGQDIKIKGHDEIGLLGDNINDMTHQLVEAAVYENMLLGGKEVQRAFLPLDMVDPVSKTKLSVGHMDTDNVKFFGYYEGAKGVSGDYFDFRNLDGRYFALIKCDVSGKGSPAALIMAEVAALFCDYFKTWSYKKNGTNLAPLVSKINDQVESRNLKGKFAAFTLALYDTKLGDLYFCNAGDNIIHIYDSTEHKKKTLTLTETPPAGPFPSFMVEMKGGYPVEKIHLNKGDIIFLYTDGIEEAKRLYRDVETGKALRFKPESNELVTDEEDKDATDGEEMSPERVNAIIEAVMARKKYKLVKKANPIDDMDQVEFEFDFTGCNGEPEEVCLALVCVEKAFRMYKDNNTGPYDHAVIDKKVDVFMKEHFLQYDTYCSEHSEHPTPELQSEYMYYTNVKEDEQFDDLTLVAIKQK
ncbi:MAG: SpoIIE family protein phosphatase [Treponemataceae bacterium]|nr:SpoIIE family protein phosphatase [Treponemataceae bacterium]